MKIVCFLLTYLCFFHSDCFVMEMLIMNHRNATMDEMEFISYRPELISRKKNHSTSIEYETIKLN